MRRSPEDDGVGIFLNGKGELARTSAGGTTLSFTYKTRWEGPIDNIPSMRLAPSLCKKNKNRITNFKNYNNYM